jgi:hypothetical protein
VFARNASGNVAPIRVIAGAATGLDFMIGVFVDLQHDELYVSDRDGAIRVYSRAALGDTAPLWVISGAATGLINPQGIFLNNMDEIIVAIEGGSIRVFPRLASGNIAPSRVIAGALTTLGAGVGIAGTNAAGGAEGQVAGGSLLFEDGFEGPD